MIPDLRGHKAVVLGAGKSGLAAARLLRGEGAAVTVVDRKAESELEDAAATIKSVGAELRCGDVPEGLVESAKVVVVSPGVPLQQPAVERARAAGVQVVSEVEYAYQRLEPKRPLVGITGTNGKSTTTSLCGELFDQSGLETFVGGNLGLPLSESLLTGKRWDAHVVELSSFQLEGIQEFRCSAAAITNLTPDHLDRYPSHREYAEAKRRIFLNQTSQDAAVVNADDHAVVDLARSGAARLYGFTLGEKLDLSRFAGGAVRMEGGFRFLDGRTFRVANRALRGEHNLQNAMAASLLAALSGVIDRAIQEGLDQFKGLPHRLEVVRRLDEVEWINDSKATNVDSAVVALRAFSGPVWLIAGGRGKGAPYAPMVEVSRGRVKGVLTVGEDAPAIESAYQPLSGEVEVVPCGTLEKAIAEARARARRREVVLLSPACASYDQFKNFEDRGNTFKRLVKELE
ncbi:MAG TPA: UDP-N-acetylmuramoyl-L-alanine--D-glutamate ligase [Myxococcales bacterium]|jgi:UDP-N-acetylmuramoylalanine--D-glutamate ligase|nr:UDP-N-acetylmuramoyl-L-alanine--D-glutamate ligase [Myxococcales bacterium]